MFNVHQRYFGISLNCGSSSGFIQLMEKWDSCNDDNVHIMIETNWGVNSNSAKMINWIIRIMKQSISIK